MQEEEWPNPFVAFIFTFKTLTSASRATKQEEELVNYVRYRGRDGCI